MILGIDVSNYQGSDITDLFDGRDFCFVKVTEGSHTIDSGWEGRVSQARAAGLVVGAYSFAHPENPVSGDADHFIDTFRPHLEPGDLIALDWEITGGLSWSAGTAWKDEWISRVQAAFPDNLVGLYCNTSTWHSETSSKYGDFLWIASYGVDDPGIEADWKIWQYTSSPVDTDKAKFASRTDMKTWALSKDDDTPAPDPEPEPDGTVIDSQKWATLDLDNSSAGSVIVEGPIGVMATCFVRLTATEGSEIQGRFYTTGLDAEREITYPIAERVATRGSSFADYTLPTFVPDGQVLRFEVKVFDYDAASVTVEACEVHAVTWGVADVA